MDDRNIPPLHDPLHPPRDRVQVTNVMEPIQLTEITVPLAMDCGGITPESMALRHAALQLDTMAADNGGAARVVQKLDFLYYDTPHPMVTVRLFTSAPADEPV